MFKIILFFAAFAFVFVQSQQTYPLACRGPLWTEVIVDQQNIQFILRYSHGSQSATQQTVPSGYCSWLDRGMYSSEPTMLLYEKTGVYSPIFVGIFQGTTGSFTVDNDSTASALQLLTASSNEIVILNAYSGSSYMIVTSLEGESSASKDSIRASVQNANPGVHVLFGSEPLTNKTSLANK